MSSRPKMKQAKIVFCFETTGQTGRRSPLQHTGHTSSRNTSCLLPAYQPQFGQHGDGCCTATSKTEPKSAITGRLQPKHTKAKGCVKSGRAKQAAMLSVRKIRKCFGLRTDLLLTLALSTTAQNSQTRDPLCPLSPLELPLPSEQV